MNSSLLNFTSLFLLLILSLIAGIAVGATNIPLAEQMQILLAFFIRTECDPTHRFIIIHVRLPRVLLGALAGFSLALCGGIMQGIFRNPLADPYILGIASGATAGAASVIALHLSWIPLAVPAGAFIGATACVFLVYTVSQTRAGHISNYNLILAGVAIGAFFSSITAFLIFISKNDQMRHIIFWIMGSLSIVRWSSLLCLSIVVGMGTLIALSFAEHLNALALGDDMAGHLGVRPSSVKKILLCLTTLLTASVVCMTGTIGFVGLIVPHVMRLLTGPDHRRLLLACGFAGASFLVLCDILTRVAIRPAEIPVGIITSLFGAPFFLFLLIRRRQRIGL